MEREDPSQVGAGGGGGQTASTGTGTGGTLDPGCGSYDDEAGSPVTVRFINKSGENVYLDAECQHLPGLVAPVESDGLGYGDPICTCETVRKEGESACIAAGCPPSTLRLAPGQAREVVWRGTALRSEALPAGCVAGQDEGESCVRKVVPPAQDYRVAVRGFSECESGSGGASCACDASGFCDGSSKGLEAFYESPTFSYPSDDLVEVVFDVCTFGCGGGG